LYQLLHLFYSFIYTFYWCLKGNGEKIIICDIFASSSSRGAIAASRLFNIRRCAIITDMIATPITTEFDIKKIWWKIFFKTRRWNQRNILKRYDQFIFLTQQMNLIYNPLNKPYIVMEGSVDYSFTPNTNIQKHEPRIIMYAGSIEAEYGFNELVQAFMALPNSDVELHIYGNGKFVKTLHDYQKQDSRVKYQGIVSNEQIVALEQQATLLVNPRLSHEDFVKYSFPSKTSEYMLSGTPLLTTKLPGIPKEYFDYLYTFEEETIEGFAKKMYEILALPSEELKIKGLNAQQFILQHKNNVIQTKRLINFFKNTSI
jgi:glycosyltransferase involved in cell wall biosynthesis